MTPNAEPELILSWFASLSDFARVRILRMLVQHELTVGELAKALQLPQSTVSRHLKVLFESMWVVRRSAGTASLYAVNLDELDPSARAIWTLVSDRMEPTATLQEDDHRVAQILAERRTSTRAFFESIGGQWEDVRDELFGRDYSLDAMLGLLDSDLVVGDLGCGTGTATSMIAPWVKHVHAVDREPAMLDAARLRLADFPNVTLHEGELRKLPFEDESLDAALAFLVFHHVIDPRAAVQEVGRTLRPGGKLIILDMVAHDRDTFRQTMGHEHLGFDEDQIRSWMEGSAFDALTYHRARPETDAKGPGLFIAALRRG